MRTVLTANHELYRVQVQRFLKEFVLPFHSKWERSGTVPRDVWLRAGENGILCPSLPEKYGGAGGDFGYSAVVIEEIACSGASGLGFALHSDIAAPYLLAYGTEETKEQYLPRMARGELIGAIAMSEPGMGSDLKAVGTTARRDGNEYIVNGQKTFITNGRNCGLVIVVTRTELSAGHRGITLILVEEGAPGFSKGHNLEKIGLHALDTVELFFHDVRVPVRNRLGEEGRGFSYLMEQLNQERLVVAIRAAAVVEAMLDATIVYTKERRAFGQPVFEFQNTRFRLADAAAQSAMLRAFVDECLGQHLRSALPSERAAMVKLVATEIQNRLLDEFLQLHGGYGYMRESSIGRAWVDARVTRILGGSSEIMKEIISRGL